MNGYKSEAELLKALAHPIRLQILEVLHAEGEACVCHLETRLGQRQAYISQQLSKLREAGFVVDRRDGLNVFYAVMDESIPAFLGLAKQLTVHLAGMDGISRVGLEQVVRITGEYDHSNHVHREIRHDLM